MKASKKELHIAYANVPASRVSEVDNAFQDLEVLDAEVMPDDSTRRVLRLRMYALSGKEARARANKISETYGQEVA